MLSLRFLEGEGSVLGQDEQLCQTEVQNLQHVVGLNPQITGLKVAVKNALRMSGGQSARQLDAQRHYLLLRQSTRSQPFVERSSGDVLQHQVVHSLFGVEVVHRLDVGVVQPAQDEGFLAKAFA